MRSKFDAASLPSSSALRADLIDESFRLSLFFFICAQARATVWSPCDIVVVLKGFLAFSFRAHRRLRHRCRLTVVRRHRRSILGKAFSLSFFVLIGVYDIVV
jgi:hypothetical protein